MSEEIHITADIDLVGADISAWLARRRIDSYTLCGISTQPDENGNCPSYTYLDEVLDWFDGEPTCTACVLLYFERGM